MTLGVTGARERTWRYKSLECDWQSFETFFRPPNRGAMHNSYRKEVKNNMNISKTITGIVSTIALMAVAATAAMAQQQTFASATGGGPGVSTVFTYTGGPGGQFTTSAGAMFQGTFLPTFATNAPATLVFTGFSVSGVATGTGTTTDPYRQGLSGGTFTLDSGGTNLLQGRFADGNLLTSVSNSTTAGIITNSVNNVTYTGGTYFGLSGLNNPGSFSISMTSVAPPPSISGGYLTGFTAGGTSTFSAQTPSTVPEPATVVPFMLGGLGLLGLIVRKTRRTSSAAA